MALTIVVNGGGTFSASMEEGPVSFTASLAAVGPAGPAGPGVAEGGLTGQVLAKASGTDYDTEWVARNPFDQELNENDIVNFQGVVTDEIVFRNDLSTQTTALPSGLADGYIVEWNEDTNTYVSVPNDARTLFITARNITGTTIPKGSAVLISGASGNRPTIALAQADTGAGADGVIGITGEAIANNANGRVITEGLASNLNTSAFAAGDKLYLSATTPGGLVTVRPVQPAHSVAIGTVTWSNPAVGTIEVRVQVGEHLEFLHDVLLTSRANGDFLVYESATDLWKNRTLASLDLLTATSAAATYLTQSSAAATYQTLAGMSAYLTTSAAAATYYPLTGNPSGFLVSGDLSGYLLSSTAATTYAPIVHTHTASQVTDFDTAADARVNALVPAASDTVAGKVELATDAEAVAGTSSTLAVTPAALEAGVGEAIVFDATANNAGASATSGAGAAVTQTQGFNKAVGGPTSAIGHALIRWGINVSLGGSGWNSVFNFDRTFIFNGLIARTAGTDVNSEGWFVIGDGGTITNTAAPNDKSFGFKIVGTTVWGFVHDGTNLVLSTTTFTAGTTPFEIKAISDGLGSVSFRISTTSFTMTGGPTGTPTTTFRNAIGMKVVNIDTLTGSALTLYASKLRLRIK